MKKVKTDTTRVEMLHRFDGFGKMPKVTLNTPAPDFELADFRGRPIRLSALRGRLVLLVFNRGFI